MTKPIFALNRKPAPASLTLALDRSTRTYDADGRLHVAVANISKAVVNPYYGREIPGCEELGLDPEKLYQLYRDPEELARAAPTFNNIQLMFTHIPVDADDPQKELIAGTTGDKCAFVAPYLQNSLAVWDQEAIDAIESGDTRELSCGYRYIPDMTPGIVEFTPYDGVMRNIVGNHVALVREGRAGPDVLVGDEKPEIEQMFKLKPRKSARAKAIVAAMDGKLSDEAGKALDAELEDLDKAEDEAEEEKKKAEAEDADTEDKDDDRAEDEDPDDKDDKGGKAMDAKLARLKSDMAKDTAAAVSAAVKAERERHMALDEARTVVRPVVGEVTAALDSADKIYRYALDHLKVDHAAVKDSAALKVLVQNLGNVKAPQPKIAADAASVDSFNKLFPDASRIRGR